MGYLRRFVPRPWMALALALVLGLGAYFEFRSKATATPGALVFATAGQHPLPVFTSRKSAPPVSQSPVPTAPSTRLFAEPRLDEDEAIDRFVKLLAGDDSSPSARAVGLAFTEEFRDAPALKKVYDDFREQPATKERTREFMRKLGSMPEFRRLTARFAGAPGVRGMLGLYQGVKARDINEVAREWAGKAKLASAGPVSSGPVAPVASQGPVAQAGPVTSVQLGGAFRATPSAERGPSVSAIHGGGGTALAGARGPHQAILSAGAADAPPSGSAGSRDLAPGGGPSALGAHDVDANLRKSGPYSGGWTDCKSGSSNCPDDKKHIVAMLKHMPIDKRKEIEAALGVNGETATADDLWSACFITKNFNLCKSMCTKPGVKCSQQYQNTTYWQACLSDGLRKEKDCIVRCVDLESDGCSVEVGSWATQCAAKAVPCDYCANFLDYGKVERVPGPPPRDVPPQKGCHVVKRPGGTEDSGTPPPADDTDLPGGPSSFNWSDHNERRHLFAMGNDRTTPPTPPDEAASMKEINLMLRYSLNDGYLLNILGKWQAGTNDAEAVANLKGAAKKYGESMPYLAAAANLKAAELLKQQGNPDWQGLCKQVLDLQPSNGNLDTYRQAAQAALAAGQ